MILNEDALKRLYQENVNSLTIPSRNRCPSFSAIAQSFSEKTPRRKKQLITDHITCCSACFKEFSFLIQLQEKEKELADKAAEWASLRNHSYATKRSIPLFYEYASAGMVILLLFASLLFVLSSFYYPSVRGNSLKYIDTISPAGQTAADGRLTFIWEVVDAASIYTVELYDDALRLIWKASDIPSPNITLPSSLLASLQPNLTYYWLVTGKAANQHLYHSYLQVFTIFRQTNFMFKKNKNYIPH